MTFFLYITLLSFMICMTISVNAVVPTQCNALTDIILFDKCHDRELELASYKGPKGFSRNLVRNLSNAAVGESKECAALPSICRRILKVKRIRGKSFQTKMQVQISDMLYQCCGQCAKYFMEDAFKLLRSHSMQTFDIIFPVTARSAAVTQLYGFHYIPVLEIPSAYYVTLHKTRVVLSLQLIAACLRLWPYFLGCILLSIVFGCIMWVLERSRNGSQFSERFPGGCFHGFWWSWVTMSTVGYGDKSPKSVAGRLFAVACILVGMTTFATYTALVTSSTLKVYSPPDTHLAGKVVGSLAYRVHDSIMIEQHGGIINNVNTSSVVRGVFELIRRLKRGQIAGYLVNKSTYRYFTRVVANPANEAIRKEYDEIVRDVHLHRSEKHFLVDRLVTGMLVRDAEKYQYFRTYFESNWLKIQGCFADNINAHNDLLDPPAYYSLLDGLFLPFLFCSLTVFAAFVVFGVIIEVKRKRSNEEEKRLNHAQ